MTDILVDLHRWLAVFGPEGTLSASLQRACEEIGRLRKEVEYLECQKTALTRALKGKVAD